MVQPAYSATAKLPRRFERQAFAEAADWFANSHLLIHPSEKQKLYQALAANGETTAPPRLEAPEGDGSLGIMEGYASGILYDGNQLRRLPLRDDCNAESAMVLALDSRFDGRKQHGLIASNLLDFIYFSSGMCQGPRADPQHGAFGLIGWGDVAPAWLVANYGDDNARGMLATALVAASLKTDRWDERLMRALLANLRTTGTLGFGPTASTCRLWRRTVGSHIIRAPPSITRPTSKCTSGRATCGHGSRPASSHSSTAPRPPLP